MIIIAGCLYLPEHFTTMASRAWFYYAGPDEPANTANILRKTAVGNGGAGFGTGSMTGSARGEGQQVLDHLGNL